ncbi:hypothetical protein JCM1840_005873 [Sporobolomyces johnsonii]
MSCCCTSPSSAVLGSSIFLLVVFVPAGFYELTQAIFHFEDLDSKALYIVSIVTALGAVVAAIVALVGRGCRSVMTLKAAYWSGGASTVLAVVSTVWNAVANAKPLDSTESKVVGAGTTVILALIFVLVPLAWFTYETFELSSHPLNRGQRVPTTTTDDADDDLDVRGSASEKKRKRSGQVVGQQQAQEMMMAELGRSAPFGRARRGGQRQPVRRDGEAWDSHSGSEDSEESSEGEAKKRLTSGRRAGRRT